MTIGAAFQQFYSGFGMSAYPATNVPENAVLPYLTYTMQEGFFGDSPISQTVQLWFKTESEAIPNAKVKEIALEIGRGGVVLPVDDGAVWLKKGSPFSIASNAQEDSTIKLRQLNITLEFLTQ